MTRFNTPQSKNEFVEKLLLKLNTKSDVIFVPIIPESYAKSGDCYYNVEEKVKKDGGKIRYGWTIYQSENICEAERHAIWENPEGILIDITQNTIQAKDIMFVSDNVDLGHDVDNIRINTTNLKVIDDFIKLFEMKAELFQKFGKRIDEKRINIPSYLLPIINMLETTIAQYQQYIDLKHMKCICGSNKNYEDCHHNIIIKEISNFISRNS